MPYHFKEGDDLNLAVMYARGWNDAVRAAAKIAEHIGGWEGTAILNRIKALDKAVEACDD